MLQTIFDFSPLIVAIIPVILGIVEVVKQVGLPSKFAPLVSVMVGVGLVALTGEIWQSIVAQGLIAGLAASGLWSGAKSTFSA